MRRRPAGWLFAAAALSLGGPFGLWAQETPPPSSPRKEADAPSIVEATPQSMRAIERGLEYLSTRQSRIGSFGTQYQVAITSLTCLAFLANGNQPGQGRYGPHIRAGIEYLVRDCAPKRGGFITEPGGNAQSRMHGHGLATLFLAEVWGMAESLPPDLQTRLHDVIEGGVRCIETSQSSRGGWYYTADVRQHDMDEGSVTVCSLAALRAARDAGFSVDKTVIDKAISYLKKSANKDGTFRYSLSMGQTRSSSALTAAAVSALNYTGEYALPEVRAGLKYLQGFKPGGANRGSGHQFYEDYYAALAMFQAGGDYWDGWFPLIREDLLKRQSKGGSWEGEYGGEYCTAFACLILQIPNRYLPIFQR